MRQCLERLRENKHAGRLIEIGPEAYPPEHITPHHPNAGDFDIIYGLDEEENLKVYGLIQAL